MIDPSSRGASVFDEVENKMDELWDVFYERQRQHAGVPDISKSASFSEQMDISAIPQV
jgi:hypothetical protein